MMDRPNDIPEDVWNSAINCAETVCRNLPADYGDMTIEVTAIARSIMAERERAALVCEARAEAFLSPEYATGQPLSSFSERFACDLCAAAIRKDTP